jgi:hypothetical protein
MRLSGNHAHRAELSEVIIEREGFLDLEAHHDDPAHAIREAPVLVAESLEYLPRLLDILRLDPDEGCAGLREDPLSELFRPVLLFSP